MGGIKKVVEKAGAVYINGNTKYSGNDIICAAKSFYEKHGYVKNDEFNAETGISDCAIKHYFSSFNQMLEAANIPYYMKHHYSRDDIFSDVSKIIEQYHSTSSTIYRQYGRISQSAIDREFGSWENLMRVMGYEKLRKRYGVEYMKTKIIDLYNQYGFLSAPMITEECDFTYTAASYALGGVRGITELVGDKCAFDKSKSTGHLKIRSALLELFGTGRFHEEQTFEWLINPDTGCHLYFDFYIPEINTAIEFQGAQHYCYTEWFCKTDKDFENYVKRDEIKKRLSSLYMVRLICISYKEKIDVEYIKTLINS